MAFFNYLCESYKIFLDGGDDYNESFEKLKFVFGIIIIIYS